MTRYEKALSGVRGWSGILDLHSEGHSPRDLKEACEQTLKSVLRVASAVDELRRDHLIAEAVNLQRIFQDSWSASHFWWCLELHWRAYSIDSDAAIEECARWELKINRGLSHYWSNLQLEQKKGDLALEDFAAEAFRNIGSLLEATTQPFLRGLLGHLRLAREKKTQNIDDLDFGVVVSELASTSGAPDLFAPPPWGVSLSQWRNIAQHHNFIIDADVITVHYGKGGGIRSLDLSRADLWESLCCIFRIQLIIKTARTMFFLDNRKSLVNQLASVPERSDALVFGFATVMASQGFEVTAIEVRSDHARAVLREVTDMPPYIRQFHASQLVQHLWAATGAMKCELEYQQRDGTPTLLTIALAADCDAVGKEEIDIREFAQRVTLQILANCDPPSDLDEHFSQMS